METVVGAWKPFYRLGAILVHWITGILRDSTGVYNHAFVIGAAMAAAALILICPVKKQGNDETGTPLTRSDLFPILLTSSAFKK